MKDALTREKGVVHVFVADYFFHVLTMIEVILKFSKKKHSIVLIALGNVNWGSYKDLISRHPTVRFECLEGAPKNPAWIVRVLLWLSRYSLGRRLVPGLSSFEVNRLNVLWRHRKEAVLLHGTDLNSRLTFLLSMGLFRSCSWVCWGNVPRLPTVSTVYQKMRRAWYIAGLRHLKRIVCLLEGDAGAFAELGCNNVEIHTYPAEFLHFYDPSLLGDERKSEEPLRVLIGNSAHYLKEHAEAIDRMGKYRDHIRVTCMLNYGPSDRSAMDCFELEAVRRLGQAYEPWKNILPLDQYMGELKKHSIYICYVRTQTGLGAIYGMLIFGNKLYLNGVNLAWIRKLGFIVHDVAELDSQTFDEFRQPLPPEARVFNYERLRQLFDVELLTKKWDGLYERIE